MLEYILTAGIHILFVKPSNEPADRYRWINTVLEDPKGMKDRAGNKLQTPYIDPPPGGFEYDVADNSRYYWDDNDCVECAVRHKESYNRFRNSYEFIDYPKDYRLKPGEKIMFKTCIVDTYENDKEIDCIRWNWIRSENNLNGSTEVVR